MPGFSITTLSIWLYLTGGLCAVLAFAAYQRKQSVCAHFFALATLSSGIYAAGYALELGAQSFAAMRLALRIEYIGVPFISSLWLMMAYSYVHQRAMRRRTQAILLFVPALSFMLAQTNEYHGWFYKALEYSQIDGLCIANITHGPWYYVHTAYTNLCFLIYNLILLRSCRQAQPLYRIQAILLMGGSLIPWVCLLIFLSGLSPRDIDLNPFGMGFVALIGGVAVWRYEFLNLAPSARDIAFSSIEEGVLIVDPLHRLTDFNTAACAIFPQLNPNSIGQALPEIINTPVLSQALYKAERKPVLFTQSASLQTFEARCYPLRGKQAEYQGDVILIRDVSERLALERELMRLATRDELTGLHNRRYLIECAEHTIQLAKRHGRPLTVLIGDLDYFKQVNDQHGHLAGDRLLQKVAHCLQRRLRQSDIVGRYGGDEFVVVLPETQQEDAESIVEELRHAITEDTGHSMSIGLAALHPTMESFSEVLAEADAALYRRKALRTEELRAVPLH